MYNSLFNQYYNKMKQQFPNANDEDVQTRAMYETDLDLVGKGYDSAKNPITGELLGQEVNGLLSKSGYKYSNPSMFGSMFDKKDTRPQNAFKHAAQKFRGGINSIFGTHFANGGKF